MAASGHAFNITLLPNPARHDGTSVTNYLPAGPGGWLSSLPEKWIIITEQFVQLNESECLLLSQTDSLGGLGCPDLSDGRNHSVSVSSFFFF